MKSPRLSLLLSLIMLATLLSAPRSHGQDQQPLILTSTAPLYYLTQALTEGTGIEVRNLPDPPRPLAALADYYQRQASNQTALLQRAELVISMASLWDGDLLYAAGRDVNIRLLHIDAVRSLSLLPGGIPIATSPVTGARLPHFWLSPATLVASLDIIARDLQRLYPDQAPRIASNLEQERRHFNGMRSRMEAALLMAEDPVLFALADEFLYLSHDLGIEVEGYFIKQDINWAQDDLDALTERLRGAGIRVVLHKWEPASPIQQAITAAGARLVVLDPLEVPANDWRQAIERNLETLIRSFSD